MTRAIQRQSGRRPADGLAHACELVASIRTREERILELLDELDGVLEGGV